MKFGSCFEFTLWTGHLSGEYGGKYSDGFDDFKKVDSAVLKFRDYKKDLFELVAPGWDMVFSRHHFHANGGVGFKAAVVGLLDKEYFSIGDLLSAYHEFGHTHDFTPYFYSGIDVKSTYDRALGPSSNAEYKDMLTVLSLETSAWGFALDNIKEVLEARNDFETEKEKKVWVGEELDKLKVSARSHVAGYFNCAAGKDGSALNIICDRDGIRREDLLKDFKYQCNVFDKKFIKPHGGK